jgi:kynurenine formamidase
MNKFIDLSHNIVNNMVVHPYDNAVKLYQDKFLQDDKYNNFRLEIGMHAGTHIDTPMHLINRKTFINEISIERFIGKGCLLDVRNESVIGYKEKYWDIVSKDDIILLFTNYSDKYGTEEYFTNHPVIDKELADFFIEKKIKILGIDLPSPDKYPFEIHKKLFENNILIIENMTNLSELLHISNFEIIALPLKIKAEASMARVIAKIDI